MPRRPVLLAMLLLLGACSRCGGGGGGPDTDAGPDAAPPVDGAVDAAPDVELPPLEPDECGDVRRLALVFYGTLAPRYVPLSRGEILAVGDLPGCTGTLVAPRWVLTARHCRIRAGETFCMGDDPGDPEECLTASRVVHHPSVDMSLVELSGDATEQLPGVLPIAPMTETLDATWIGRDAEAAGYGDTETGLSGTRKFVAVPISDLDADYVAIDGGGERGVCFGDSGGPLLVVASDGTVRVAGALSEGSDSCVGEDWFARTDAVQAWIEEQIGAIAPRSGCGVIDGAGRCLSGMAVWCGDDGMRHAEACTDPARCGFSAEAEGFRCIEGDDPCGGLDGFGRCDGSTARWCRDGEPRSRDCAACGEVCAVVPSAGSIYCMPDPCMGLDYTGQCDGDVVQWCDDGVFRSRDCAADDLGCAFIDDETGYYCE